MDHTEKKRQGPARPADYHTTPANDANVAPAAAPGFDDHTAQNALQQPQATAKNHPYPYPEWLVSYLGLNSTYRDYSAWLERREVQL